MELHEVFTYHPTAYFESLPKRPWRLDSWVFATNGHLLVALADDGRPADDAPGKMQNARRFLGEVEQPRQMSLARLRKFAGKFQPEDDDCDD